MTAWNAFRVSGDLSHILSKFILIFSIHRNRSAEGVSFLTQVFYAIVFCTRYTDIFREESKWNLFFKIFYIASSFYIIGVMQWVFPRTREREVSWKIGAAVLGGSLILSPFTMLIFEPVWSFFMWLYDFSEILESVCVLPQLILLRQTSVPTVIDSFYLLTLGLYRLLYVFNWIARALDPSDRRPNAVSVIFGCIQTALYLDFAWVYYSRQRVKLRYGGVVDADDIRQGWLLRRIFGRHIDNMEVDDEESAPALRSGSGQPQQNGRAKWNARGISVRAEDDQDDVLESERFVNDSADADELSGFVDPDARMHDPDELAKALDEDNEESPPTSAKLDPSPSGVRGGDEWDD